MQTIILHIGMPKTGTTTIQKALNSGAKELKECDAIFPKSGMFSEGAAAHHALFYSVASSLSAIRTPLPHPKESFEAMVEDLRNEMNISRSKFTILSSEMLWNPIAFDRTALCRIREAFPGYKFIILAYLRPVEEHSVSAYAQRVTGPQLYDRSYREHLEELCQRGTYDFSQRLNDFLEVFGEDSVYAVWLPWLEGDVLSPVTRHVKELQIVSPAKRENERRSWLFVRTVRWLNCLKRLRLIGLRNLLVRILLRFESHYMQNSILERKLYPACAKEKILLGEKTRKELSELQKKKWLLEA